MAARLVPPASARLVPNDMTKRASSLPSQVQAGRATARTARVALPAFKLASGALLVASAACFAQGRVVQKVVLFQTYQEVKRTLGQPLAEGPPLECLGPQRSHLMLYERPDALLQLVFDARLRLRMIRLMATKEPPKRARTLQWPGLDTWFAVLRPYAEVEDAFPVFYHDEMFTRFDYWRVAHYWETQPPHTNLRSID